ncbi:MAG: tetratricopeptide repeat protein [Bryobacteraceae bacterium]|nr:tetratricopeptide repeat protein [Bryobacteraceae bacterium]
MTLLLAATLVAALHAQTPEECHKHRHYGRLTEAANCYEKLSFSTNPAVRAEGLWGLKLYTQANDAFRAAVAREPKNPDIRVRWGRMFVEHYQTPDAAKLFQEALEIRKDHPGANIGMALVAAGSFEAKAVEFAEEALKADPKNVEAQEVLARLALEDVNFDKAVKEAEKAVALSAEALDAMAVLATVDVLRDKPSTPWFDRIARINPVYGEAEAFCAHMLILNRRYEEAIEYMKKALAKNAKLWDVQSELGITYMRLGLEKDARRHLELAYENGWKDPQTVNSLRLMDSYKNFETFAKPRTIVRLHKKESDLLKLYFEPELERAIAAFEKKYRFPLKKPVQLEVYPDHEDFAVRTLGMPGLGALGVTFGYVVAMDSPSGRKPGSFHWASTLWHELSHVFVLAATNHRTPRWFTEGLAVHEETAVAPDWGDRLDPTVLKAIQQKKLLPISQLDRGFIRPTYPNQVIVSYFQAGKICDYINQKWGWDKLLSMMHAFAKNTSTADVVQAQLGMKPEDFDREFMEWLLKQVNTPLNRFEEWSKRVRLIAAAAKNKQHDEVIKQGLEIRDWYTEYVEPGNIYEFLSEAYLAKGDKKAAAAELERYASTGGRYPETLKKLANLQTELGRPKDAITTLEKLNYIYPVEDSEMHRKLGDLALHNGSLNTAIREFQAAVASKPLDPAASHFNLAQAYAKANRLKDAEDAVLSALEAAPGYRPAQKLLLELNKQKEAR